MTELLLSVALFAQVQLQVQVAVPQVRFEVAPPVVEVQRGVYVVPDYDEEVFLIGGVYWVRAGDGRWYRARDYRGGWAAVPPRSVPAVLVHTPRGHYKHYKSKTKEKHGRVEVKMKGKPGKKGKRGKWK